MLEEKLLAEKSVSKFLVPLPSRSGIVLFIFQKPNILVSQHTHKQYAKNVFISILNSQNRTERYFEHFKGQFRRLVSLKSSTNVFQQIDNQCGKKNVAGYFGGWCLKKIVNPT